MKTSKIRVTCAAFVGWQLGNDGFVSVLPLSQDDQVKRLPIDPFAGLSFMINEQGWLKNDIQAYEDTHNVSVARAILQRCPVFTADKPDNLSLDERLSQIIPANCSSPSEFVRVSKHIAQEQYARRVAQEKAAAAAQAAFKKEPVKKEVKQEAE